MGNIFGSDTRSRLLLLGDLIAVTLGVLCVMASIIIVGSAGTCDIDVCSTKLCVIEEEGSLCGSLLLKGNGGTLGLSRWGKLERADLSTIDELDGGSREE